MSTVTRWPVYHCMCLLYDRRFLCTCFAAERQIRPALHTLSVPKLVTHVVAEVVVAGAAHFVALAAVIVFVTAYADGVLEAGDQAFILHRLLLLSGVDHPFVDAAFNEQLVIWTKDKRDSTVEFLTGRLL